MANTQDIITELYKAFRLMNNKYYNNCLPEPAILIQNRGNKKNVLGWCTVNKLWDDKSLNEKKYEIAIISEYLNRGIYSVISTLMHEMVHLYNLENNIKDTSRNGTYHNKRFKAEAEAHGLLIDFDKNIGWSPTKLNTESIEIINNANLNKSAFMISRNDFQQVLEADPEAEAKTPPKKSKFKYICTNCNSIITSSKEMSLHCNDCNNDFVLVS